MSAADSAWLRVDRDNNPMVITAVLILARGVAFSDVRERLTERLSAYPRLRQRIVEPRTRFGAPCWEDDPDFDIARQTEASCLAAPAGQPALEAFIGDLMPRRLDPNRPLWRVFYVDGYADGGVAGDAAGAAIVVRVHHCIADGIALLRILLSLSDEPPEITFPTAAATWARPGERASITSLIVNSLRIAGRSATHFARFLASRADPETRFSIPLGAKKSAAWSAPIPLDDLKRAGSAHAGTVNEIVLSAAAGALGRVLANDRGFKPDWTLRGVVPVNLRADEALSALGNHFGLVFMPMPVGTAAPLTRLALVRDAMARIKASPEALGWFAILRALGRVPARVEAFGVELFSRKASLVITSLAGPRQELHFCGSAIEDVMFWVPCAGNVGLGMSVLAYNGRVRLGVASDAAQIEDPHTIVRGFEAEVSALFEGICD